MTSAVVELSAVSKDYRALRPLRIDRLALGGGEQVAVLGVDLPAAEVLINLITGASLPDRGDVRVFGRPTAAIQDSAEWLSFVDHFGIVSDRVVLLDALTLVQNLAVPFSLDIEPPADDVLERALGLAREVGLQEDAWDRPVECLDGAARVRVRLARALALDPAVVLLEHPTASVSPSHAALLGRDIRGIAQRRGATTLTLTADVEFASAVATRVLTLDPATGHLAERRRWFGRRLR